MSDYTTGPGDKANVGEVRGERGEGRRGRGEGRRRGEGGEGRGERMGEDALIK